MHSNKAHLVEEVMSALPQKRTSGRCTTTRSANPICAETKVETPLLFGS
jgi:hypothetical protein